LRRNKEIKEEEIGRKEEEKKIYYKTATVIID